MLRALFFIPFLLLLIAFALSNQQTVGLALWPTDFVLQAPLSLAILVAAGLFFFLGALFVWFGGVAARGRAKRAERKIQILEARVRELTPAPQTAAAKPSMALLTRDS